MLDLDFITLSDDTAPRYHHLVLFNLCHIITMHTMRELLKKAQSMLCTVLYLIIYAKTINASSVG